MLIAKAWRAHMLNIRDSVFDNRIPLVDVGIGILNYWVNGPLGIGLVACDSWVRQRQNVDCAHPRLGALRLSSCRQSSFFKRGREMQAL